MEKAKLVHKGKPLQNLIQNVANTCFRESFSAGFHRFIQIFRHVFEYEKQLVVFADDLLELDYVGMVELFQRDHFAQLHALAPAAESLLHFLNGYDLPCTLVHRLQNATIGSIAERVCNFVPVHGFLSF